MPEEKKTHTPKPITEVRLRSYPKVIFFYPLLFTSLVLWIIQLIIGDSPASQYLGSFWMMIFFLNLFVIAFDFGSSKFFILILFVVVFIFVMIFFVIPITGLAYVADILAALNLTLTWQFYMVAFLVLLFILIFVILSANLDYYRIERNEIYHKKGILADAERFPVKSLRLKKEIPDVFEYFILRAGSITLMPGKIDEVITLKTVLNVNKKAEQIDFLLSHISVEPDEID